MLCNVRAYTRRSPQRGDLVVCRAPRDMALGGPVKKRYLVLCLVGLPGDTIAVSGGVLHRNGVPVDEPYLRYPMFYEFPTRPYLPTDCDKWGGLVEVAGITSVRVPNGRFFVLGDNRNNSNDSHRWGYLRRRAIRGKAVLIYWPLSRARFL